jgi:hypothetical protein
LNDGVVGDCCGYLNEFEETKLAYFKNPFVPKLKLKNVKINTEINK